MQQNVNVTKWTNISEYLYKCEQVWTDVEDETSISETGKQGTCIVRTMYICQWYSVHSVQYMSVRQNSTYSSTVCAVMSQSNHWKCYLKCNNVDTNQI